MAFRVFDYSNTHAFHRKALLNAVERVNAATTMTEDLTILVSTRNMVKALPRALFGGMKTVVSLVGFGRLYSDYGAAGRFVFNAIVRLYGRFSACAFIVEHEVDRLILERLTSKPVFSSHGSGLDTEGFTRKRRKRGKIIKIGYLSRFHKSKGSHEVVNIAKALPEDRELIIAGWDISGDTYSRAFEALATSRPNIYFLGRLENRAGVSQFFNSIDLFLSPSVREGGNISLQEGIWHGVPFMTTNAPGCAVLAERFNCPALPMNQFAKGVLECDLPKMAPDQSMPDQIGWDDLLQPFLAEAVEDELTGILTDIAEGRQKSR